MKTNYFLSLFFVASFSIANNQIDLEKLLEAQHKGNSIQIYGSHSENAAENKNRLNQIAEEQEQKRYERERSRPSFKQMEYSENQQKINSNQYKVIESNSKSTLIECLAGSRKGKLERIYINDNGEYTIPGFIVASYKNRSFQKVIQYTCEDTDTYY